MIKLQERRDYYAGALCILFGLGVVIQATHYTVGSLQHMGPGFFPIMLGVLMIFMGGLIISAAIFGEPEETDALHHQTRDTPDWRGCACIIAGVVLFIVMARWFGMAPAIFVSVAVAALGDRSATLKGTFGLAAGMTIFGVFLFSYVLSIAMPVWLWFGE